MPAFAAAYAVRTRELGNTPTFALTDDMHTMRPNCPSIMAGATACDQM